MLPATEDGSQNVEHVPERCSATWEAGLGVLVVRRADWDHHHTNAGEAEASRDVVRLVVRVGPHRPPEHFSVIVRI